MWLKVRVDDPSFGKVYLRVFAYLDLKGFAVHVVLSENYFGWAVPKGPIPLPGFLKSAYEVIPIELIEYAEFQPQGIYRRCRVLLHLQPGSTNGMIKLVVSFPYRWIKALEKCRVPVFEHGSCRLTSLAGIFANFADSLLALLLGTAFVAVGSWFLLVKHHNFFPALIVCLALTSTCIVVISDLVKYRKGRDSSDGNGE